MSQKIFGSKDSTGRKLDIIENYLSMYQQALSNTRLSTMYIDAFAGSGEVPLTDKSYGLFDEDSQFDEEGQTVLSGSAERAMSIEPRFSRYSFIDKKRECVETLKEKFRSHSNFTHASFSIGDANNEVQKICYDTNWRFKRGVVLLDPFGSQVKWETIEAIANTEALDLWYLLPAGLGVFRQIANNGTVDQTHKASITRLFGTQEWQRAFLTPKSEPDLFDDNKISYQKTVTPESAAQYMMDRLQNVFKGGVMDAMIPLGKHAYPSHYLLFAWANPSPKAKALANKLSKAALKATDSKHGRIV